MARFLTYLMVVLGFFIVVSLVFSVIGFAESEEIVIEEKVYRELNNLPGGNGVVTNIWLLEADKFDVLREHNIKYLFVDVGDTKYDGKLATQERSIRKFLDFVFKYEEETDHDFILLPYSEINTHEFNFDSLGFQANFIVDYLKLVEWGFDGVYVDVEPVQFNQRETYLGFLENLNEEFGEDAIISVYSGHFGNSESNPWIWDHEFVEKVANRVDLIFVGVYDTSASNSEEYNLKLENIFTEISSNKWNSQFTVGIPAHKPNPESIENAMEFYLNEGDNLGERFVGLSIFSEWTMDEDEWEVFEKNV